MGGRGCRATTSGEVKQGTTQTRLFDTDKFCLFRVTGGCKAKKNRAICWMVACQISLCCWADAKPEMHLGKLTYICQYAFYSILFSHSGQQCCHKASNQVFFTVHSKSRAVAKQSINLCIPLCSATVYDWFPWWCYWFTCNSVTIPFSNCMWIKSCVDHC